MAITFVWPTDTKRITSEFGNRIHPITGSKSFHPGLDIADRGTNPIIVAADGTISRSYLSSSYGETIFIEHSVNGQTWETVYAHMRLGSRAYVTGQKVKQGKQIGIMGSTGNSTGQHLHFELHRGKWNYSKTNALDPEKYLEKDLFPKSDSTLRNGDTGKAVKELQEEIVSLGYKLPRYGIDSDFGDETENAIRAFQKNAGIFIDGIVGPQTYTALEKATKVNQTKTLYLPAVKSWNVYPLGKAPVVGNEIASLSPAKFGGLSYEVLDIPQKDVATIQTRDFGKVNIYVASSTGATIK